MIMVYNIGKLLSVIVEDGLFVFDNPDYVEIIGGLNDPQYIQNNKYDHDNEQGVNGITRARNAREYIRSKISDQP
jgi:hypothetical protein